MLRLAVVTLFWSSFIFIGAALFGILRRRAWAKGFAEITQALPLIGRVLIWFGLGCAAMAPWIVTGFMIQAPILYPVVMYLLLLLGSMWFCARLAWVGQWWRPSFWRSYMPQRSFVLLGMAALVVALAAQFFLSYDVGSYVVNGNDAYVHMGKIEQMVQGSMTLDDPYFSGVVESRYHANVVHVINAVGVRLTNIETINFWNLSNPFFRIVCWSAVFMLAWYFSPFRSAPGRRLFAVYATILSLPLLSYAFISANYPNVLVLAWLSLWLVGFCRFAAGKDVWLLLLGSVLAGLTHPGYALGAAGFVGLYAVAMVIFRRQWMTKRRSVVLVMSGLALGLPSLVSITHPNRLPPLGNVPTTELLGETIIRPTLPALLSWLALVGILSFVGYAVILKQQRTAAERWLIGLLVAYFALLAYNPVVSMLVGDQLPPWLLDRFKFVNRIGAIAVFVGIGAVALGISKLAPRRALRKTYMAAAFTVLSIPVLVVGCSQMRLFVQTRESNATQLAIVQDISRNMKPLLTDQRVFAMPGDSFILPATTPLSVVAMPPANASPVANMEQRLKCSTVLEQTLSADALATAGVTRVLVAAWEPELMQLARSKPYLHVIGGDMRYNVFKLQKPTHYQTIPVCNIPHGQ